MSLVTIWHSLDEMRLHLAVNGKVRGRIYNALASMMENGKKMREAIDALYNIFSDQGRYPKRPAAVLLFEVRSHIENGASLATALGKWITSEERALIRSGEESGKLENTLRSAVALVDVRNRLRAKLMAAIPYPVVLSISTALTLQMIATKIVPSFEKINPVENWEGSALVMYWMAWFVNHLGIISVVALLALLGWVAWALPRRLHGNVRYHLDKWPIFRTYRRLNGALFFMGVAVLIGSGIQLKRALEILSSSANAYVKERIDGALHGIEGGLNLGHALLASDYDFPDREAIQLLTAYDDLENFDKALRQFADEDITNLEAQLTKGSDLMMMVAIAFNVLISLLIAIGGFSIQDTIPGV